MEAEDKHHGIRDLATIPNGLLAGAADIDENPADETRAQFEEHLQVEVADGRVEFASEPELQRSRRELI